MAARCIRCGRSRRKKRKKIKTRPLPPACAARWLKLVMCRWAISAAVAAAHRFTAAGAAIAVKQKDATADAAKLNTALLNAEHAFILPDGLPERPWFRHAIYAPGKYTGYAAVVIPGVNEAIDANDANRAAGQLGVLAAALNRATAALDSAAH